MDGLSLIAVAVALAMDAFAVALAAGVVLRPLCFRPCFRLAFHFGLFQALMPVIGWLAGLTVQGFVAAWSHWIAFCLLVWVGGHMIREALAVHNEVIMDYSIHREEGVFPMVPAGKATTEMLLL